jgi:anti-anti-sigma factor
MLSQGRSQGMQVLSSAQGNTLVLEVSGRLDADAAPEFERDCREQIVAGQRHVVLDCEALEYISSAGLRSILALAKELTGRDGDLAVCSLTGLVKEVFEISGFAKMLPVYSDLEEALSES